MRLNEEALKDACDLLARAMLSTAGDGSRDIVETVSTQLMDLAHQHVLFIEQMGRDPNILVRVIVYMTHVHGLPFGADIKRVGTMLDCLLELAVHNVGLTHNSALFLADVGLGVELSLSDVSRD